MIRSTHALFLSALFAAPAAAQVTNAPVAPDTIYVGRRGASGGLSVIDLNGFGASTGDPTFDEFHPLPGNSNYPNNPNLRLQGALMRPPLYPGTTTENGGSAGVFTLTRNSYLDDRLLQSPAIQSISDMMLGQPLDLVFNAGPAPSGCQGGSGSLCSIVGLRVLNVGLLPGANVLIPVPLGSPDTLYTFQGPGNPISWAPHPNPPPRINPPSCYAPLIAGQEPSSVDTQVPNLLGPGDPLGDPLHQPVPIPPTGLLVSEQNTFFQGPSFNQLTISNCQPYSLRQQIGQFLYIADRVAGQIVVANSNNMRILQRIALPDATELAMSPDLRLMAVTQPSLNVVAFVDIDPSSLTFHQIVHVTHVGNAPRGIAWTPDNEDILVCNEGSDSVSILSVATLDVRKTVHRGLDRPFAIAITARDPNFGFQRNVYLAWILDRTGHVSLFESGPDGVNGWGFDDIIWRTPYAFPHAKAIQPDPLSLLGAVWIAHEVKLDPDGNPTSQIGGAVSNLAVYAAQVGQQPLQPGELPNLRNRTMKIVRSIGDDQLTGTPLDLAFDDQRNLGILPVVPGPFSAGTVVPINGKHTVRQVNGSAHNTNEATYLFVPVRGAQPGQERIDVIKLANGLRIDTSAFQAGIQSIPAPGASVVASYFRQ
jgi:YVTN family beta-propeller protein